jgi:hypothetical protein
MNIVLISLYEKSYHHLVPHYSVCLFPDFRCFSYFSRNCIAIISACQGPFQIFLCIEVGHELLSLSLCYCFV